MASASSSLKIKVLQQEEGQVTLTLTGSEARTLRAILNRVGGLSDSSARGYADNVGRALDSAGIYSPFTFDSKHIEGSVYFGVGSDIEVEKP